MFVFLVHPVHPSPGTPCHTRKKPHLIGSSNPRIRFTAGLARNDPIQFIVFTTPNPIHHVFTTLTETVKGM